MLKGSQFRIGGTSLLDIDARQRREALAAGRATREAAPATGPWQLTWLGDMLTPQHNSFGVLRLAMALFVVVSHAVFLTTGHVSSEPLVAWTGYSLGQHAVQVFFILSGILVAQSLFQSRSVRDYAIARCLRVFPGLIVCVLLTALVLGPLVSGLSTATYLKEKWTALYIVKTLTLSTGSAELPAVFAHNPVPGAVNTSVWTLKYEMLCYILLAIVGAALLQIRMWRATAVAFVGLWLVFALLVPTGISEADGQRSAAQVLQYFTIFFGAGVLAYAGRRYIPVHPVLLLPLAGLFVACIGTRFDEPAMALFLGYASLWLATFRFGPLRAFTNANDYSYAVYLYHYPIAQTILHLFPAIALVPLIGLTAAAVLPFAILSWELVERPAMALRKRFRVTSAPTAVVAGPARKALPQRA